MLGTLQSSRVRSEGRQSISGPIIITKRDMPDLDTKTLQLLQGTIVDPSCST